MLDESERGGVLRSGSAPWTSWREPRTQPRPAPARTRLRQTLRRRAAVSPMSASSTRWTAVSPASRWSAATLDARWRPRTSAWRSAPAPMGRACAESSAAASTSASRCGRQGVQGPRRATAAAGDHPLGRQPLGRAVRGRRRPRRHRRSRAPPAPHRPRGARGEAGAATRRCPTPRRDCGGAARAGERALACRVRPPATASDCWRGWRWRSSRPAWRCSSRCSPSRSFDHVLVHRNYSLLNVLTIAMLGVLALSLARHDVPAPHARADRGWDRRRDARLHHRAPASRCRSPTSRRGGPATSNGASTASARSARCSCRAASWRSPP